jgi:glycosyltransferase involved in cell wall biosynthesis
VAVTPASGEVGARATPIDGDGADDTRPTMRVLHVMPNLGRAYGGPVQALVGYVAAGAMAGVRSTVLGPRPAAADAAWLGRELGTADVVMAGPTESGPWAAAPAVLARLRALLPAVDVVHVHGLLNPISSGAARLARGRRPVVIGPFGTMSRYTFTYRRSVAKRWYFRLADGPNLRTADALHFTTDAERDEAAWHGIAFGDRAHVVPPPYQPPPSTPPAVRVPGDEPIVMYLGRFHPVKGIDVLVDAWPSVRARYPLARLMIAGTGSPGYEATLRRRAASLGPHADSIRFVGFLEGADKAASLAGASLCVLPSRHENFGIAVLDAVAAGVPAVVTPGVQLAPWVEAEGVGLVTDRSPGELAAAIVRALGDAALRDRARRCGAASVARDFGPAAIAPALRSMYDAGCTRAARAGRGAR